MAKDIIKSTAIYTLLGFLPLAFAVLFTPIYLKYLGETQYGILNLFLLYSGLLTQIYGMGIPSAFGFYYWDVYKEKESLKKLISNTISFLILIQILFISIGILFGKDLLKILVKDVESFSYSPYFLVMLLYSGIMVFYELFLYYFRNQENLKLYSISSVSTLILFTLGSIVGVIVLELEATGAIIGRTMGYGLVVLTFLIYFIRKFGFAIDLKYYKKLIVFSFPLFINAIIGGVAYSMDRLLVERFISLEALGVYGFAIVIISVIEIWFNALSNALSPTLYRFMNEYLIEKSKEIQGIAHIIILSVLLLIVLIIAVLLPILELLIPLPFHEVAKYVPILAAGYIWKVFTFLSCYSLYLKKKTKYMPIDQISYLLLTLGLGYLGYKLLGLQGIVIAVFTVKVIEFIIMYYITNTILSLPLKLKKFILLAIVLAMSVFATTFFSSDNNFDYLLYLLPMFTVIAISPFLLKEEIQNVRHCVINRKVLFNNTH